MSDEIPADGVGMKAGRREWLGLALLALPTLLISIDLYVMLLALPHIANDLGASSTQQLWVVDIYGFLLAGFLVTMGSIGDRIGRRKLLLIGAVGFAAASVITAYSDSTALLIAARALCGLAGAAIAPSTMSLIRTMFRDPKEMGVAIGIWAMAFTGGAIIGPLVGGLMLGTFWWGSVFLLGVPVMLALVILGPKLLPEYRHENPGKLDLLSVGLSMAGILPVIYGLKELAKHGWAVGPVLAVVIGVTFTVTFVVRQRRLTNPLLDMTLFANKHFSAALGSMLFGTMLMGAIMLFVTQQFQLVNGLSSLKAGLWMMPAVAANMIGFAVSPILGRTIRPAYLIGAGMCVSAIGLLMITQVSTTGGPLLLSLGFAVIFLGAGPLVTLGVGLIMGSAPVEKAGNAAAVNETSGQLGFALGIATLGSLVTLVYRNTVTTPAGVSGSTVAGVNESLAGAVQAAANEPAALAQQVVAQAKDAFTNGLHVVAVVSAALLVTVAVITARLLRTVPPTGQTEAGATEAAPAAGEETPGDAAEAA